MLPSKQEYEELTRECDVNRLSTSLDLIFGNESENRILGLLKGFEKTLNTAFLNNIRPLPAYKWLDRQTGFILGERKVFPEGKTDSLERKAASVMRLSQKLLQSEALFGGDRQTALRAAMIRAAHLMQRRHYWIGCVSKCLSRYHYPIAQNLGKMQAELSAACQKISDARQAILQISHLSEYVVGLPLPDDDLLFRLDVLAGFLQHDRLENLTPIKRADSSFRERLFVVQLADLHARYLQRDDGMPSVIADLFYLEGFARPLDERTIRRVCAEQRERRSLSEETGARAYRDASVKRMGAAS